MKVVEGGVIRRTTEDKLWNMRVGVIKFNSVGPQQTPGVGAEGVLEIASDMHMPGQWTPYEAGEELRYEASNSNNTTIFEVVHERGPYKYDVRVTVPPG